MRTRAPCARCCVEPPPSWVLLSTNNLKVCDVLELDYSVRKQIGDENSEAMPWKEKNWIYATMPIGNPYVEQAEQYFIANEIKVARNSTSFSLIQLPWHEKLGCGRIPAPGPRHSAVNSGKGAKGTEKPNDNILMRNLKCYLFHNPETPTRHMYISG